jgi:hypothetical protein
MSKVRKLNSTDKTKIRAMLDGFQQDNHIERESSHQEERGWYLSDFSDRNSRNIVML